MLWLLTRGVRLTTARAPFVTHTEMHPRSILKAVIEATTIITTTGVFKEAR